MGFSYSQGIPLLDTSGEKISKGLTKKLEKLYIAQEKKYNEYLATASKQYIHERIDLFR